MTADTAATSLWPSADLDAWHAALTRYSAVIAAQHVSRLVELDEWYRGELPRTIAARRPGWISLDELIRVTEWKMKRGVWRQRNLLLVKSNDPDRVERDSRDALAQVPSPLAPMTILARLAGVGPATASAVASAAAPEVYPFFDEIVATQIPDLGTVDFTAKYYARYADALRARATALGPDWTPTKVERALWSHAGGKAPGRMGT